MACGCGFVCGYIIAIVTTQKVHWNYARSLSVNNLYADKQTQTVYQQRLRVVHKDQKNTIQIYSVTTYISLETGQSSQKTIEPITPDLQKHLWDQDTITLYNAGNY